MRTTSATGPAVVDEREALLTYLRAQRDSALAVVAGLSPEDMARSVVPSAWSPATMVVHLAAAEWYWFSHMLGGDPGPDPTPRDPDPRTAYVAECAASEAVLAGLSLDAGPQVEVPAVHVELARSARTVVLHMIEETARHVGHLDIARELLDGATGLGPR